MIDDDVPNSAVDLINKDRVREAFYRTKYQIN